jgi:hypothetical protein
MAVSIRRGNGACVFVCLEGIVRLRIVQQKTGALAETGSRYGKDPVQGL